MSEHKFKIGDKVKVIKNIGGEFYDKHIGYTFTVKDYCGPHYKIGIVDRDGTDESVWYDRELELVERKTLKIGGLVRVLDFRNSEKREPIVVPSWVRDMDQFIGKITVVEDVLTPSGYVHLKGCHGWSWSEEWLEPLESVEGEIIKNTQIKQKTMETSFIGKFKNLFTSEPKKSLIKAGLVREDGTATNDGLNIFLGWLMVNGSDSKKFMDEVVTPILADMKEEKCK